MTGKLRRLCEVEISHIVTIGERLRRPTTKQIEALASSRREIGPTQPIVVRPLDVEDDGGPSGADGC
jgi:ParB-like chromosome segregation protein Spo0J